MNKQIEIYEIIPFLKNGWVACDRQGRWFWFSSKPIFDILTGLLFHYNKKGKQILLSDCFDIIPEKDWFRSCIKIERIGNDY